jgi:hypothetical protein
MGLYRTNVALAIKSDRVEKNSEIELTDEEAAIFDPADISPVDGSPADELEAPVEEIAIEDMSFDRLKAKAKELGLSAGGSKSDLQERITLHLAGGSADEDAQPEPDAPETEGDEPEADELTPEPDAAEGDITNS